MRILFVAGFGPVVRDIAESRRFYRDTLGISFEGDEDDYLHTGDVDGSRYFALWRLEDAAESCFGTAHWPDDLPIPQAWMEFDVENMAEAVEELQAAGYRLLVADRTEPWSQVVSRLLSPEGLLVGVTITPWMREELSPERQPVVVGAPTASA
jgi:catechol 2,3-dioxygenase-like lactoylglutathione lyase family enzyme